MSNDATGEQWRDAILGGRPRHSLAALSKATGLSEDYLRRYWSWLGLPAGSADEVRYTDADLASLTALTGLTASTGIDDETTRSIVRALGHSSERLAYWLIEAMVEHTTRSGHMPDTEARRAQLTEMPPVTSALAEQFEHAFRRQIVAVVERYKDDAEQAVKDGAEPDLDLPLARAVGFADVVSFTERTAGMPPKALAKFVERFETRVRDTVTAAGGRVVKTVGDGVVFLADSPELGANAALELASPRCEFVNAEVRASLVWGRVLPQFGDIFGPSVILAARLSQQARAGEVLTDSGTAEALADDGFGFTRLEPVELKGIGVVRPIRLERPVQSLTPGQQGC